MPPKNSRRKKNSAGSSSGDTSASHSDLFGDVVFQDLSEEMCKVYVLLEKKFASSLKDMQSELDDKDEAMKKLEQQVVDLQQTVLSFEERVEDQEAYERRDTIVLSGRDTIPAATTSENATNVVCNLIRSKIGIVINPSEVSTAYRLGKKANKLPILGISSPNSTVVIRNWIC